MVDNPKRWSQKKRASFVKECIEGYGGGVDAALSRFDELLSTSEMRIGSDSFLTHLSSEDREKSADEFGSITKLLRTAINEMSKARKDFGFYKDTVDAYMRRVM